MNKVLFGDVVKDIKINVDRNNNPYEHYIAGDHMCSEDLTLRTKGTFATDDVGPAFTRIFKPGQILYGSRRTYLKKIAVADFEGITANTTFVLETKDNSVLLQELLPFIMLSEAFTAWSIKKSKGSTNPYVLFSDLASFEFDLPPIEEQKILADKLWAAYRLKESYKKLFAATDDMVKSQFIEMLAIDPQYKTLDNACSYIGKGITPKYVETSTIAVVNQACVYWDGLHLDNVKYHDSGIALKKSLLENGDVLLNSTGSGTLGRSCLYINPGGDKDYITDGHVAVLKTEPKFILPEVLVMYFSLKDTQEELYRNYVTGSTNQVDIVFTSIKNMQIPTPQIDLQKKFISIKHQADKSKFELRKSIEAIDSVIKSLINNQ